MPTAAALSHPPTAALALPGARRAPTTPRAAAVARVCCRRGAPRPAAPRAARRRACRVLASDKPGSEEGVAAVGSDLSWERVARDVKARLAGVVGAKGAKADQLQQWCARAAPSGGWFGGLRPGLASAPAPSRCNNPSQSANPGARPAMPLLPQAVPGQAAPHGRVGR